MTLYIPKELIVNLNMKKARIITAVISAVLLIAASVTVITIIKKKTAPDFSRTAFSLFQFNPSLLNSGKAFFFTGIVKASPVLFIRKLLL